MSTANDGMSFSKLIAVIGVLAVASVGCLLALLWVSSTVKSAYTSQQIAAGLASEFRQASDDLTRTVRLYVVTGDDRFKNEYNTIADRLDGKAARADYIVDTSGTKQETIRQTESVYRSLRSLVQ